MATVTFLSAIIHVFARCIANQRIFAYHLHPKYCLLYWLSLKLYISYAQMSNAIRQEKPSYSPLQMIWHCGLQPPRGDQSLVQVYYLCAIKKQMTTTHIIWRRVLCMNVTYIIPFWLLSNDWGWCHQLPVPLNWTLVFVKRELSVSKW